MVERDQKSAIAVSERLRSRMADIADQVADHAEAFARLLDSAASRGHSERRTALARYEREVAAAERRNAEILRGSQGPPLRLEHLPRRPSLSKGASDLPSRAIPIGG